MVKLPIHCDECGRNNFHYGRCMCQPNAPTYNELRERLKSAEHFADFVLRHTMPERAAAHGAETIHNIIANHPFAKSVRPPHEPDIQPTRSATTRT